MKLLGLFFLLLVITAIFFLYSQQKYEVSNMHFVSTPSERDVYVGAWVGDFWSNDLKTLDTQKLKKFEQVIGKKQAIANIYSEWSYLSDKKLLNSLREISGNGWVPMVSSNPFFFSECPETNDSLYKTIADGTCDTFLRAVAINLRTYEKPLMLRFAWEMNLPNMYWSVSKVKSTPEEFIDAWKHFHTILKQEKATNVIWVLSFNTSNSKTIPYNKLYPGDAYVDWVAIDGYNWGNSHEWSGWASFNGVFRKSYNELTAITDKPVMLSEVNSAPTGGDKAKWLRDMLEEQIPHNFPQVKALIFFNENKTGGEQVDWRIEKSPDYVTAVKKGLTNKIYKSAYP